jgi:hypothetical protein
MIYYLLIFELQNKRYEFLKIQLKSYLNFYFEFCFNQKSPRVCFLSVRNSSVGSAMGAAGSYEDRTHEISPYRFV